MANTQGTSPGQTTSGGQGITYEARMCKLLFFRGYTRNQKHNATIEALKKATTGTNGGVFTNQDIEHFKLEYQVPEAAQFDDIVFDTGSGTYQIFQFKHKENEIKVIPQTNQNLQSPQASQSTNQVVEINKIEHFDLFSKEFNKNYNLIKYVKAFIKANSDVRFKDKIDAAVVFTNISFDLTNDELSLTTVAKNPRSVDTQWYNGIDSIKLTPIKPDPAAIFDMSGSVPEAKYYKFTGDPEIVKILKRQAVTFARDVGPITEDEIREALDKIIFAVKQPNVQKVTEIIKDEITEQFNLKNADTIDCILEKQFTDWCNTKKPFGQISSNDQKQHVLTFVDADTFFQKYVKVVTFEVTAPTDAFVGRVQELEKIRQQLNKQSNLIVSSTLTISGLGGIGKTQLARQFIKEFGESDFYKRVIWIDAESDGSVKNSFKRLAQVLEVQDEKETEVLIQEVFQYFKGLKVLFVLDNFDVSPINKGTLVTYCLEIASGLPKDSRPYFLITSRNQECLPRVPLLDLNVLSPEDAIQLIKYELIEEPKLRKNETIIHFTDDETNELAEKLATTLERFPLALRQALAYIKQQSEQQQIMSKRFYIQDYLKKFNEEKQDWLSFDFPEDFKNNEKTTFITWNVTLRAIEADQVHGENAIKVLRIFSNLNANKIDPKMFLYLFDNSEDQTTRAMLLLEKYSMITRVANVMTFYQMHRLVQSVVQLQFNETKDKEALLEKTCELIYPELYKKAFNDTEEDNADEVTNLMENCSFDQLLHYNTLSVQMLKHDQLKSKYEDFFSDLNEKVLLQPIYNDDVDKIKALKMSTEYLRNIIENYIEEIMKRKPKKVLKYSIEVGALEVNKQLKGKSSIEWSVENDNVDIFKFLIEEGAQFSTVLKCMTTELVTEIREGKVDSFQTLTGDSSRKILNESLFIATLFDQKTIVKHLLENRNDLDLQYKDWPFTYVAASLSYKVLLQILLEKSDKQHLYKCLIKLVKDRNFGDKKTTEIILNKYVELGGRHTDIFSEGNESLSYARHRQPKKEIFQVLSGASGALGSIYLARMCMWSFVRGYTRELKSFTLESEVKGTEKFNDVVFADGSGDYQMIQLKHKKHEEIYPTKSKDPKNTNKNKQNEQPWSSTSKQEQKLVKQVIKVADLFSAKYNSNYNLIKYVKDFNDTNSTDQFKDKIKAAVVFTNIGLDLKNDELDLKGCPSKSAREWFDGITSIKLTPIQPEATAIYDMTSVAPDAKYFKFTDDPNIIQILMRQAKKLAKDVGGISENEIRAALKKIIFAVEQPNVLDIKEIIKAEIEHHFKLNDVDTIYSILAEHFLDWCNIKSQFNQSSRRHSDIPKQHVLMYEDANEFFQKYVKRVSFGVFAPTDAFTGRFRELEKIRQQLNENHNLIVSQTLTISGLGGIGKTELVKQFIKEFGQSDFYSRVVWIEADNDETVKHSFEQLAQRVKIQDVYHKKVKVLIDEVFQYFAGLKVLFVFDNFNKSPMNKGDLVTYCWKTVSSVSSSSKSKRPYFLFTSRNRDCLPGVPLLDLNVLLPEETVQLIKKELTKVNLTEADVEKLAKDLQYFPLALRQAIAFIKQQHTTKQLFCKRYEIQDYFTKFEKKTKDLLGFEFSGDFGNNEKSTFITWNVTLDAIRADKFHDHAIKVLKIFAYLYPDKIDPKIFLTLFDNDDEKTAEALLLLEKYSMITKVNQEENTFYQIHRLVQAVVQLKFKNESRATQEQTLKLINPELYKEYFGYWFMKLFNSQSLQTLINECSPDQLRHYKALSVHMLQHENLKIKYERFFTDLPKSILLDTENK